MAKYVCLVAATCLVCGKRAKSSVCNISLLYQPAAAKKAEKLEEDLAASKAAAARAAAISG